MKSCEARHRQDEQPYNVSSNDLRAGQGLSIVIILDRTLAGFQLVKKRLQQRIRNLTFVGLGTCCNDRVKDPQFLHS